MAILGFFLGPIGRWIIISVASVAFMAWVRADARAPYVAAVTELKTAIENRDKNAERDRKLAEAQAESAGHRNAELEKIVAGIGGGACRLSAAELGQLRQLAGAR